MKNVKGRLGKVLRTKLLFALNPEDKLDVPKKGAVTIQKDIEDIRIILYTVQEKDTISSVAEKFNVSTLDIIFANQLYSNQTLYIGQVLYVYEDLTATNPTPENITNIPNSPPTTNINLPAITSNPPSSNTTPVSSPTITALPPPSSSFSSIITVPQEHQLVSLFPSSDAAVLDTMSSYRLLLPNLRAINDANLSKSAADSSASSAIQSNTILQLAMKLNSNEFFEEVKERVVYVSSRENQRAPGVLTATPRQIVFEPDWDSPLMEQGLLNYRIQMSINDIIDCHMIMESVPPPLYEMELQFYDEEDSDLGANKESYLQISVQSGIDPRVIRFIVPSEKLTSLYHKIMAWTGRPIHASRVAIPSLPLSAFSPPASVPSSVPNSNRNSPTMRSTPAPVMSESSLFSAATSKLRTMYQPDLSVIKERVSYITKIAKVRGVLTLTSNMVIFEPDLDDPTVVQHGLIANQINFFMADVYDCVFQNPTSTPSTPVSTSNPPDSPSWTLVDSNVSPEPRLIVTIRDGNGEKNVEFGTDKDKVDPIYAKITQHMGGRPKDKPRAPQSIASSPSLIPSTSPPSPTHFSLASSPASNLFSSLKNSNILSKFSIPSLSRSNSDLTPIQPIDMMDEITPQQRMIQEIEDYDIRILPAPSNLITQERTKFLRRYLNSSLAFNDWKLLYSTEVHGISMNTMYAKTREKGPVFIVIEDTNRHVFGGYASESLHVSSRYYGTGESFLFKLAPSYSVYPWPNSNSFFVLTTETFMSMGGGESGKYGFWVDADFQKGSSGFCNTFHNPPLSEKETFECLVLEIWGFA